MNDFNHVRSSLSYMTSVDVSRANVLESLTLESFRKLLKPLPGDLNEKISEFVILIFYIKEIRNLIIDFVHCRNIYCKALPCLLKEVFKDASRYSSTRSRVPQVGLSSLADGFHLTYKSKACIETILDLFLVFIHSLGNEKCSAQGNSEYLLKINSTFNCKCGRKRSLLSEASFFSVQINNFTDFIGEQFHKVFKSQVEGPVFKFCSNNSCVYKESKKVVEIIQPPLFVIFRLNWNENASVDYILKSIKSEFNLSDLGSGLSKVYKACILISENSVYYEESGKWFTKNESFCNFPMMISELSQSSFKLNAVIYIKTLESAHSASNTLSESVVPSPKIQPKSQNLASSIAQNCSVCSLTQEKCRCTKRPCEKCKTNLPNFGLYCESCRSSEMDYRYTTYSSPKCKICSANISEGDLCTACKLKPLDSSLTLSKKKAQDPVVICKACRSLSTEGFCTYCNSLCRTPTCTKCETGRFIICEACKNKTPKRPSSTSTIHKKKCYNCSNLLKKEEENNCSKCFIKALQLPCNKCRSSPIQYICSNCMNNKKRLPKRYN